MSSAGPLIVEGIPVTSSPQPWRWSLTEIGADDKGERVYLLRLYTSTGIGELWAPASFLREFFQKGAAQVGAGLSIARDLPPNPNGTP